MYTFNPSRRSKENKPQNKTRASFHATRGRKSVNNFAVSGTLIADACFFRNGTARFTIAHPFGGDQGTPDLRTDFVLFPTNGSKAIRVSATLLKKGKNVIVKGFRKPNVHVDRRGRLHNEINYVALEVLDNS